MTMSPWIISTLMPVLVAACVFLLAPPAAHAQQATVTGAEPRPIEVATVPFAGPLENFLLDKVHQRIYLTDASGRLSVLSAADYHVIATLPFAGQLMLDPIYPRLYVARGYRSLGDKQPPAIQIIDTETLTVTASISNATHLALDPQHGRIFAGNALPPLSPPHPPIAGLRVLDAATLETLAAAPLDGIPVYNPLRDELLLVAYSLFRVDPTHLKVLADLFPELTAQPCKDCVGTQQVSAVTVLPEQNLLALDIYVSRTRGVSALNPPLRFLNATTLEPIAAETPLTVQPTCNRRVFLQPRLNKRVYRARSYANMFAFYNWRIEDAAGRLLAEMDGLDAPFLNANTGQAYANGWVLALPTLQPLGRLPALTCIFEHDAERGLIYARRQKELVILAEAGEEHNPAPPPPVAQLPPHEITQIALAPNFEQDPTLFVVQYNTLYRSRDGGQRWTPLTTLPLTNVTALHVALSPDFARDHTLFVGGGEQFGSSDQLTGGVFRSTDGGDHWQPVWQGLRHLRVYDVAVSPNFARDQTVLAYAHYLQFAPIHEGKSIQRSTDGGLTWSLWITQTDMTLPAPEALLPRATPPPVLPVRLVDYDYQLARSPDQGATWEGIDLQKYLGSGVRTLVAAPDFAESGVVYVLGERALWRVRDQGAIIEPWDDPRLVGRKAYTEGLSSLVVSPLQHDGSYRLVLGTDGGEVWVLNPTEMQWQSPLPVDTTPLTPRQAGLAPQPLFYYTVGQGDATQIVVRGMDGGQRQAFRLPAGGQRTDINWRAHALSPDGAWLAFYTGDVSRPHQAAGDDLTLHVLNLQSGEALTVAALLPPNFPENLEINARRIAERIPDVADDPQLMEGIWEVFAPALTTFAWSPDGQTLAFAGAMDGPSTDLYLYHVADHNITRLTDGPEQIDGIRWSPDGQWILHSSVSIGYCQSCYGHKYAAAADGSGVITIPGDESDRFLAWLGPDRYLESEQANGIGDFHLSEVDLTAQTQRTFWAGSYRSFVLRRGEQRMFIQGWPTPSTRPDQSALYSVDLRTGQFFTTSLAALPSDVAIRLTSYPVLACPFASTIIAYPCADGPASPFSPDGHWWVDADLTLHTADKRLVLPSAVPQQSHSIYWRRDSAGFYFMAEGNLYYRPLLESWPQLVEPGVAWLAWAEDQ